jgi:hypothetical protein
MSFRSRKRGAECLSDLLLDTLVAGDLSAELSASARAHTDACEPCRARYEELVGQGESAALAVLSSERRRGHGAPRAPSSPARPRGAVPARWRWVGVAAAACCAFLLFERFALREGTAPGERLKGGGRLGFFVQRGGEVLRGGEGELLHPGDSLQFTFFAASAGYLVVLGRDAAGSVTVYYPSASTAAPVAAGEQALPESTLLDHTVGEETIEAVFCPSPRDVEAVRAAWQRAGARELGDCTVDTLRIAKEAP